MQEYIEYMQEYIEAQISGLVDSLYQKLNEKQWFEKILTRLSFGKMQSEQKTLQWSLMMIPDTFYRNFRDRKYGTSYTHFQLHIYFKRSIQVYHGTLHTKMTKIKSTLFSTLLGELAEILCHNFTFWTLILHLIPKTGSSLQGTWFLQAVTVYFLNGLAWIPPMKYDVFKSLKPLTSLQGRIIIDF